MPLFKSTSDKHGEDSTFENIIYKFMIMQKNLMWNFEEKYEETLITSMCLYSVYCKINKCDHGDLHLLFNR